jgi:hypothetical protein
MRKKRITHKYNSKDPWPEGAKGFDLAAFLAKSKYPSFVLFAPFVVQLFF